MTYLLHALAILGLGVYSAIGLHYYSILISRIRLYFVRFLLWLPAVALLVLAPAFTAIALVPRGGRFGILIWLLWAIPPYVYAAKNWRAFQDRMGGPKSTGSTLEGLLPK
jgi:hypothetical protein